MRSRSWWTRPNGIGQPLLIWHGGALAGALLGPFGNYGRDPFLFTLLFWWIVTGVSLALAWAIQTLARRVVPSWVPWQRDALIALPAFALVFTPVLFLLMQALLDRPAGDRPGLVAVGVMVVTVCGVIVLGKELLRILRRLMLAEPRRAAAAAAEPRRAAPPLLAERLEPALRGPILRLSGDNHHIQVLTDKGEGRVHMRFADALHDLDPAAGMRVHRSHWVARAAALRLERDGHRRWLVLRDGTQVPVARGYADDLLRCWPELRGEKGNTSGAPDPEGGSISARVPGPKSAAKAGSEQSSPPV